MIERYLEEEKEREIGHYDVIADRSLSGAGRQ